MLCAAVHREVSTFKTHPRPTPCPPRAAQAQCAIEFATGLPP